MTMPVSHLWRRVGTWLIVVDANGARWGLYKGGGVWYAISEAYEGTARVSHIDLGYGRDDVRCTKCGRPTSSTLPIGFPCDLDGETGECADYEYLPRSGLAQLIDSYAKGHTPL